ncbi:MAG: TetR/AcrR family transcriptional regulator [Ardenticatenaceae bacterium]
MPRHKEFDQNKVLDKAIELFWRQGYHATSIQHLVAHLGISRSSLYDTFGDKHSLFLSALTRYTQQGSSHTKQVLGTKLGYEAIELLFEGLVEQAVNDSLCRGCFIANSTTELAVNDDQVANKVYRNRCDYEALFYDFLVRAQANGEVSAKHDARALARFLFSAIQGIAVIAKTRPERQVLEDIVNVTLSVLR